MSFATYPSLAGRGVLITGGGSGIGASLVRHFVEQDANVAFLDIAEEASSALVSELEAEFSRPPSFFPCDITDHDALMTGIGLAKEAVGPVRVLVNNAGNDDRHNFQDVTPDYWDERMAVLIKHQFSLLKRCTKK